MALMDPNTGLGTEAPALDGTGKKIFDAIRELLATKGYPPSIREIGQRAGIDSTSHITYHLNQLTRYGFIARDPGVSRSIRVLQP